MIPWKIQWHDSSHCEPIDFQQLKIVPNRMKQKQYILENDDNQFTFYKEQRIESTGIYYTVCINHKGYVNRGVAIEFLIKFSQMNQ